MISGSRLGASFVVLVIGALEDLRAGRREARSAYIGIDRAGDDRGCLPARDGARVARADARRPLRPAARGP